MHSSSTMDEKRRNKLDKPLEKVMVYQKVVGSSPAWELRNISE